MGLVAAPTELLHHGSNAGPCSGQSRRIELDNEGVATLVGQEVIGSRQHRGLAALDVNLEESNPLVTEFLVEGHDLHFGGRSKSGGWVQRVPVSLMPPLAGSGEQHLLSAGVSDGGMDHPNLGKASASEGGGELGEGVWCRFEGDDLTRVTDHPSGQRREVADVGSDIDVGIAGSQPVAHPTLEIPVDPPSVEDDA
jgi:hypothetical protein